ncbi:MAG: 16S rRNA (guanine(966)-N(2))-methyltransferase RsmD [Flavobacterium sp. BFFFF2]|nr:MAG: 16S rRNA (guanine(966)-N(2))-methyltransferase RsmD [Flavobacterium sp. BFFFF2]
MRIIAGQFKSRRIQPPRNLPVRPTTDLSKESLFNILNNQFEWEGLRILDLFSGTGNMSYEFASRGVTEGTAVDGDRACVQFIKKTFEELEIPFKAVQSDVFGFLKQFKGQVDIVFADPPYDLPLGDYNQLVRMLFDQEIVSDIGWLIVEHSKHSDVTQHPEFSHQKHYGATVFSFFEKTSS